jgi:glyoxylase-like metal-dependent hydrolase (beta-lactamase superfamily II)
MDPTSALGRVATIVAALATLLLLSAARAEERRVEFKQVAPDLYFLYDFASSNSVVLATDEGVLVIDTRQHPRDGQDLIDRIRKITDKPIKWVINSHFHGDHHLGNPPFKALGATLVAQHDTAELMRRTWPKELARRQAFFKAHNFDPAETKLILPDVTFNSQMTIRLGGRVAVLTNFGPGQQVGDTLVYFPHARTMFTAGVFAKHSIPNMSFTPSIDRWLRLLVSIENMETVDRILPAHGDVASRTDIPEFYAMLADAYATVKAAVADGMSVDEAVRTLTLDKYKDWRNYARHEQEIRALYELIKTGKRSYLE